MFAAIRLNSVKVWFVCIFIAIILTILFISLISFRYPLKYLDIIKSNCTVYRIEPSLVCAVIHAESKFAEKAISHKGASGLMQITESTANWIAEQMDLSEYSYSRIFEPALNISIGCRYLSWLLDRYNDVDLAVAAYNAGSGNVDKWLNNPVYSPDGKRLERIPFKETSDYVRRVQVNKWIYELLL